MTEFLTAIMPNVLSAVAVAALSHVLIIQSFGRVPRSAILLCLSGNDATDCRRPSTPAYGDAE
jgi:hypothetical protein